MAISKAPSQGAIWRRHGAFVGPRYWIPEGDPYEGLQRGDLKFSWKASGLHGGWVLVRMKNDRRGGTRTNWLLIKHLDEAAREGDGDALLTDSKSVASGRSLDAIAAGKGKAPTSFITRNPTAAGAVLGTKEREETRQVLDDDGHATFHRAAAVQAGRARPPRRPGWAHEVKFDGLSHAAPRRNRPRTAPHAEGARTGPPSSPASPRPRARSRLPARTARS